MKAKEMECPVCRAKINGLTALNPMGNNPTKGDLSICSKCGTINQFDENLNIISLPDSILTEIKEHHPELIKISLELKEHGKKYRQKS